MLSGSASSTSATQVADHAGQEQQEARPAPCGRCRAGRAAAAARRACARRCCRAKRDALVAQQQEPADDRQAEPGPDRDAGPAREAHRDVEVEDRESQYNRRTRNAWRLLAARGDPRADAVARPRRRARRWRARWSSRGSPPASASARRWIHSITGAAKSKRRKEMPVVDQDARRALRRGRGRDPRPPSLRTSGDPRGPCHHGLARLSRLDRRRDDRRTVATRSRDRRPARAGDACAARALAAVAALLARGAGIGAGRTCCRARARVRVERRAARRGDGRGALRDRRRLLPVPRQAQVRGRAGARWRRRRACRPARSRTTSSSARSRPIAGALAVDLPLDRDRAGETVPLVAESQGCADVGVCYPPQRQVVAVALPGAGARPGPPVEAAPRKKSWFN